jgi:hypothetical protein
MLAPIFAVLMLISGDSPAWRVEITTTGGFAGRGQGSLNIAADGALNFHSTCGQRLGADDLKPIAILVTKAKPEQWKASYVRPSNPNGCCDMIKTTLTLTRGGRKWTSTWYSDHDALPADLDALINALWLAPQPSPSIRERYERLCNP